MSCTTGLRGRLEGSRWSRRPARRRRRPGSARRPELERLEALLLLSTVGEQEPNNALALATAMSLTQDPAGSQFYTGLGTGSIGTTSDVDYWSFTAKAGDRVSVAGDGATTSSGSIYVELRNGARPDPRRRRAIPVRPPADRPTTSSPPTAPTTSTRGPIRQRLHQRGLQRAGRRRAGFTNEAEDNGDDRRGQPDRADARRERPHDRHAWRATSPRRPTSTYVNLGLLRAGSAVDLVDRPAGREHARPEDRAGPRRRVAAPSPRPPAPVTRPSP